MATINRKLMFGKGNNKMNTEEIFQMLDEAGREIIVTSVKISCIQGFWMGEFPNRPNLKTLYQGNSLKELLEKMANDFREEKEKSEKKLQNLPDFYEKCVIIPQKG